MLELIQSAVIPLAVLLITFSMGLELTLADFGRVLRRVREVGIGASAEALVPIVVSFSLLALLDVPEMVSIGVIILVSCPSGIFSNALTYFGSGNLSLSITLTAVSSVIAFVGLPLISNLGFWLFLQQDERLSLPVMQTYLSLLILVILPLSTGMVVLSRNQRWAVANRQKLKSLSQFIIVGAMIVILIGKRADIGEESVAAAAVLAVIFLAGNAIFGFLIPRLFRLDKDSSFAIAMEVCNKNGSLVVFISAEMLEKPEYALFTAIYWAVVKVVLLPAAIFRGYAKNKEIS